jgi:hypothetical protein
MLARKNINNAISRNLVTGPTSASTNGTVDWGLLRRARYQGKTKKIIMGSIEPTAHRKGLGTRCRRASKKTQTPTRVCTPAHAN